MWSAWVWWDPESAWGQLGRGWECPEAAGGRQGSGRVWVCRAAEGERWEQASGSACLEGEDEHPGLALQGQGWVWQGLGSGLWVLGLGLEQQIGRAHV